MIQIDLDFINNF